MNEMPKALAEDLAFTQKDKVSLQQCRRSPGNPALRHLTVYEKERKLLTQSTIFL